MGDDQQDERLQRIQAMWAELSTMTEGTVQYDVLVVLVRAEVEAFLKAIPRPGQKPE